MQSASETILQVRPEPPHAGRRYIYLDQRDWIYLGRAYHGRRDGDRYADALAVAEKAVADGTAVFPLSSTHYMETSLAPRQDWRDRLAEVMERLSGFVAIADQQVIVPHELDAAISHRFGLPEPGELALFGQGAAHAFREPRYRGLDRTILSAPFLAPAARQAHERIDDAFKQGRANQRQLFRSRGYGEGVKLRQAAIGRTLADIYVPLAQAVERAGISLDMFFDEIGNDLESFVNELPSRRVIFELQVAQDASAATFKEGDLRDLGALAVAIAYCDVVVTERQWTDIVRKAKLDDALGVTVTDDLAELPAILKAIERP